MNRIEKSEEKFKQLFGEGVPGTHATDPDRLISPTTASLIFNGSNPRMTEETEAKKLLMSMQIMTLFGSCP
ncbi:hypothetical protein [Priestia megaterium]|jgi:hypothetical protein|uniref:hypothetical protein n=1 Tax=Priestia megaterium TaxID=1404 RepID=UPI00352BA599